MQPNAMANLLKSISTPRRVQILKALIESPGPVQATILSTSLSIPEGPLSWNLSKLMEVGLVMRHPHGRNVFFSANMTIVKAFLDFWQMETKDGSIDEHPREANRPLGDEINPGEDGNSD